MPHHEHLIRERAHAIWEREGRPDGRADDHWQSAIAELDADDPAAIERRREEDPLDVGGMNESLVTMGTIPGGGPGAGVAGADPFGSAPRERPLDD
jgi:hypothetical protein